MRLALARALMALDRRRGRRVVVADVEEPFFLDFLLPIVEEVRRRTDRVSFYGATQPVYLGAPELASARIPPAKWLGLAEAQAAGPCDLFLSAHIWGKAPPGALRVNVFHNQPIKYVRYPREQFENYDAHFLMGPLQRQFVERMVAEFRLGGRITLHEIGYPKLDGLVQGRHRREDVLRGHGLDPGLKTVLYAPSWDDGLSLREHGIRIAEKLLDPGDCNVLVKLHPASCVPVDHPNFQAYTGGTEWRKAFDGLRGRPRFRFLEDRNLSPVLAATDVMVTDVSSVALEYIILDRPIVFFDCPRFFEEIIPGNYADYGKISPEDARRSLLINGGREAGIVVGDPEAMQDAVRESLARPSEQSPARRRVAAQLLYNPGTAAAAAAAQLCRMLGL